MKLYTKAENRHYGVVKGFISSLPKEKHCKNVSSYLPCSSVTEPLEKPTLLRVLFVCLFSDGTLTLHFCGLQQNSQRSDQSNVLHYKRNSFFLFNGICFQRMAGFDTGTNTAQHRYIIFLSDVHFFLTTKKVLVQILED